MFTSQHIGYHKTRHCSRSGKALGDAFYGDKMKPKKSLKKKKLACANCLKIKLSEMMVPANVYLKKSKKNFAGLVATTVPEKDTIWRQIL